MTDYKLVPVEPTEAMVSAAEDAYMPFGDMDLALRMAILAAPAVQEEPVAWVTADTVDGQAVNGKPRRIWWENNEGVGMPIYASPQPPFQLPDFATDPDDSDEVASLWDHGFKRGWNSCLGAVAKAMQPAEQNPAPDVARLVEALTTARETIAAALRANELDYFATDADIARHVAIQPIDTAIAVFRKQGVTND